MLVYLKVENYAVVEKVEVEFSPHLNIFTGETGTGKSILIDALTLFLKKNIPTTSYRNEKDKLLVEAIFQKGDDEFVLRREAHKKKSLCYLNGQLVPFANLKNTAESFLNIYGQNEHVFLLNPANHRIFLDKFSHNQDLLAEISQRYNVLKRFLDELEVLKNKNSERNEKLDYLNFKISEIESLKINKGEDSQLEKRLKILTSSEEIISKSDQLIHDLYQKDNSTYNIIANNLKNIEFLKEIYPELGQLFEEVVKHYNLIPDISSALSRIKNEVEYDESELNDIEEKLMKLNRLKSKYDLATDGLLEYCQKLKDERDLLLNIGFSLKDKEKEIDRLLSDYRRLNLDLRGHRKEKAAELIAIVENELSKLEMKKARFVINIHEVEPSLENISDRGTDKIEFYFSANPDQAPGRIKDMISGGELSRLMLVLKSIIEDESSSTYIFDEIDSGIGGKTAEFVGEKLKKIASSNVVICISHLPQIASFADKHFLINKEFKDNKTYSQAKELDFEDKVKEIARLMAGSAINEDVLKAARNLLNKKPINF